MDKTVAIIGYGTAAVNAIIALRTSGFRGKIQVFSNTETLPYSPMMTSAYAAGTCEREGVFPWDACDLDQLDVCVVANAPVTSINAAAHTVTAGGVEYAYDACLIASGAHPVAPVVVQDASGAQDAFDGFDAVKPLVLRTLENAEVLRNALTSENDARVLVSGTSMVGLKAVDACLERGVDVTFLGRGEHIMRRTACDEIAAGLEGYLAEKGVDLRLSQVMEEAHLTENGQVRVTFSNGDMTDYGHVLFAHGIVPNLDFVPEDALDQAVRDCSSANALAAGLPVDEFMRTQLPDVYAAGDVARVLNKATGQHVVAGLWKEACVQGACAGRAMAAALQGEQPVGEARYDGFVPSNSITVGGAVVLSGGSMELSERRWMDVERRNGCVIATVREAANGSVSADEPANAKNARLVGYNVFSDNADPATSLAYDEAAMLYRQMNA
mgnify:CR=1 FL=1